MLQRTEQKRNTERSWGLADDSSQKTLLPINNQPEKGIPGTDKILLTGTIKVKREKSSPPCFYLWLYSGDININSFRA